MAVRRKRVSKKQCSKHGKNLPKRKSHRAASGLGRCSGQARRRKAAPRRRPNPPRRAAKKAPAKRKASSSAQKFCDRVRLPVITGCIAWDGKAWKATVTRDKKVAYKQTISYDPVTGKHLGPGDRALAQMIANREVATALPELAKYRANPSRRPKRKQSAKARRASMKNFEKALAALGRSKVAKKICGKRGRRANPPRRTRRPRFVW